MPTIHTQSAYHQLLLDDYHGAILAIMLPVDFSQSEDPHASSIGHLVPQFFNARGEPYIAANRYARKISARLMPKSTSTYSEHIKEFLVWMEGCGLELTDLDDESFELYVEALCAYQRDNGEKLSWNSVNSRVSGAHRFLTWAYSENLCPDLDPIEANSVVASAKFKYKRVKHPSKPIQEPTEFLTLEKAIEFIAKLADVPPGRNKKFLSHRNMLLGAFLLQTGVRISEACEFPLSDLPEINRLGHSTPARVIGKGHKARTILIPNELLARLWEFVDVYREKALEAIPEHEKPSRETLFTSIGGNPITTNWIQKIFRKCGRSMNITNSHPHILRHTFGTYHYFINKDLQSLASLLGHASVNTTHMFYVRTAALISYSGSYAGFQREIDELVSQIS